MVASGVIIAIKYNSYWPIIISLLIPIRPSISVSFKLYFSNQEVQPVKQKFLAMSTLVDIHASLSDF